MKKIKMNFFKILMILFILSLFSCSEDLYENESKSSSKFKVEIVNSNALIKNKELMKSLSFNEVLKPSQFGRIVSDTINGLSIDTDNVKYLEGNNFNSYTFNILNQESEKLDNLVLMSQPNGSYKPYVMRYDLTNAEKEALNNGGNIDFTNKTKVLKLYDSNLVSDIFSKLLYQEECSMTYTWEEQITITPCPIDGCLEHPWASYEVSHILVGTLNCSSGGGGGEIGGEIGTAPHGGGGGSSTSNNPPPQTPCETLNDAIQNLSVNQGIQNLKAKTLLKSESAYQIERKYNFETEIYTYTTTLKEGDNFNAVVQVGGYIKGQAHNHPINGQSIPSIGDIYWTMECQTNIYPASAFGYNITVCPNPASPNDPSTAIIYAVTVDNLATLTNQLNNIFGANFDSLTAEEKSKIYDDLNYKYVLEFADVQNSSSGMEKKFLELYANFGISLYKFDNSTNNWNKLNLQNNTVTTQPCE